VNDELEVKASEMLKSLTEALTEGTQTLTNVYTYLREQNKDNRAILEDINKLAMNVMAKIPFLTQVVSDSTKVLETYLNFKISQRQEEATRRQEEMTKVILKHNRILAYSTTLLAVSTFALVLVTVLLHL
jgi:hypothetical protein